METTTVSHEALDGQKKSQGSLLDDDDDDEETESTRSLSSRIEEPDASSPELVRQWTLSAPKLLSAVSSMTLPLPVKRNTSLGLDWSRGENLYGRTHEMERLNQALARARLGSAQTVTITGESGCGKTALIEAFCDTATNQNRDETSVLVYRAQFEQDASAGGPFYPILDGMKQLIDELELTMNRTDDSRVVWNQRFLEALDDSEVDLLHSVLPNLRRIIKTAPHRSSTVRFHSERWSTRPGLPAHASSPDLAANVNGQNMALDGLQGWSRSVRRDEARKGSSDTQVWSTGEESLMTCAHFHKDWSLERLRLALRTLLRVISTVHTVVMAVDDVQWADPESLTLLETILCDELPGKKLLFIATLQTSDPEIPTLYNFLQTAAGFCETIYLSTLNKESVSQWIQALLRQDGDDVSTLVDILYSKTAGNPFFIAQFLQLLEKRALLYYSMARFRWEWHSHKIQAETDICTNVLDVVVGKIRWLPQEQQMILIVAACLGLPSFEVPTLLTCLKPIEEGVASDEDLIFGRLDESSMSTNNTTTMTEESVTENLCQIVGQGLLERLSVHRFKFSHDRVREGSCLLFPNPGARKQMHIRIGKRLREMRDALSGPALLSTEGGDLLLQTVRQLNFGSDLILDEKEKLELAELNYEAAELAMTRSSFVPATMFLEQGQRILGPNPWSKYAQTMEKLSIALTRMDYCCGRIDESLRMADEVLLNSSTLESRLAVYHTKILCLIQAGRGEEALELTLSALDQLGTPFPRSFLTIHVKRQAWKTRRMLRSMTDDDLRDLPPAENTRDLDSVADFLEKLLEVSQYSQHPHPEYTSLVLLRMMQLTLQRGYFARTPCCFVFWGWYLAGLGEYEDAVRYGKIGLWYAERKQGGIHDARAKLLFQNYIHHWKFPYYNGIDEVSRAIKSYWDAGAVELVHIETLPYLHAYFCCGLRLEPLMTDMQRFARLMKDYQQVHSLESSLSFFQMIANLMGMSDDPMVLTGKFMDQERSYGKWQKNGYEKTLQKFYFHRMMLAYYFGDFDLAWKMSQRLWSPRVEGPDVWVPYRYLFQGLIAYAQFQGTAKPRFRRIGTSFMNRMNKFAKSGVVNCRHMHLLLAAEHVAATSSDLDEVRLAYDAAIVSAAKHGFLHTRALANERAGIYMLRNGDTAWASTYLSRAHDLYSEWGADAKARDVFQTHRNILVTDTPEGNKRYGGDFRARTRLDLISSQRYHSLRMSCYSPAEPFSPVEESFSPGESFNSSYNSGF